MARVLILFAHPRYEDSRAHAALLRYLPLQDERLMLRDLYELYPDYQVDVEAEQEALLAHDIIIWQHPFYWYSCPPLLKQWIDLVLEYNWAYGPKGGFLQGKSLFSAITSGGPETAYGPEGHNKYTVHELIRPFERTAILCRLRWLPPYLVQGTHMRGLPELDEAGKQYAQLIQALIEDKLTPDTLASFPTANLALERV